MNSESGNFINCLSVDEDLLDFLFKKKSFDFPIEF